MSNKIKLTCPVCSGILYQVWDNKNQQYYIETVHCLTCGRDYTKKAIKGQLNE